MFYQNFNSSSFYAFRTGLTMKTTTNEPIQLQFEPKVLTSGQTSKTRQVIYTYFFILQCLENETPQPQQFYLATKEDFYHLHRFSEAKFFLVSNLKLYRLHTYLTECLLIRLVWPMNAKKGCDEKLPTYLSGKI